VYDVIVKQYTFAISSPDELLVTIYEIIFVPHRPLFTLSLRHPG